MPSIGIIGAGNIGSAIAKSLARKDIEATMANSRGPESIQQFVKLIGPSISAGTREEAASKDIVFVAVKWPALPAALGGLPDWGGRIVIDANNAVQGPPLKAFDIGGRRSSAVVAGMVPGARLVKAFNHLFHMTLADDPESKSGRRVLFLAGNDNAAKADVKLLMDRMGFFGIDMGDIETGSQAFESPTGPLIVHNLVKYG